jgi:hypothetical protein
LARLFGMPAATSLTEANAQLRLTFREGYDLFSDFSLFVNAQSASSGALGTGATASVRAEPSEVYLNLGFSEHLNGLIGRKRLVWGSGFAFNPADLLNPPKDPTDLTLQRAGAWMIRLEAPFEHFTLSALWAPKVTQLEGGLPGRFLYQPGGSEAEQLFAVRAYALILKSDVNLMWFWSNRFADTLPHSHRFAASFSRYFFTDYEFHFEGVLQRGRDTLLADPSCLPTGTSFAPLFQCVAQGRSPIGAFLSDSKALYTRVIVGSRYTFRDDSLVSLEYLFNGTGLSGAQYDDRNRLLSVLPTLVALSPVAAAQANSLLGATDAGQPVRFNLQTLRRHYLFLVYQKPRIADDFSVTATTVVGLEGPSLLFAPSASWSAKEWLTLSLFAFIPVGSTVSEFGSLPFRFRAMLEVRAFY